MTNREAELREALVPFAKLSDMIECTSPHEYADTETWEVPIGDLRRARLALAQQPAPQEQAPWRPIKTAPPGEGKFWAFQPDRGQYECWWREDFQTGGYWMDRADSEPRPTHWMPLPTPPASAALNSGGGG